MTFIEKFKSQTGKIKIWLFLVDFLQKMADFLVGPQTMNYHVFHVIYLMVREAKICNQVMSLRTSFNTSRGFFTCQEMGNAHYFKHAMPLGDHRKDKVAVSCI